tara:strand:+ start:779 stop:1420 length:642 start_codon:yes stop_codon:yes gene_type:complete
MNTYNSNALAQTYGYQDPVYGQGTQNPSFGNYDPMKDLTNSFRNMDVDENQEMHDVNTMSGNQQRDPLGSRMDTGSHHKPQKWHDSANSHPMGRPHNPSSEDYHAMAPIQQGYTNPHGLNSDHDWQQALYNEGRANYGNQQQSNFGHQQSNDPMGGLTSSFGAMGFRGGRKRKKHRRKKTHKKKHKTTHKKRHKKTRAKKKHKKRKHKKKTRK